MRQAKDEREVLFCFSCDPYHGGDTSPTREALRIMGEPGLHATVLTKGAWRAERDFDLLKQYGFSFGTSVVWDNDQDGANWEPGAPLISERYRVLKDAHDAGIRTWVSLEPVIDRRQALGILLDLASFVDHWKVGKVNHQPELEAAVDWAVFLHDVTDLLDSLGADYYIKRDLAVYGTTGCNQEDV